MFSIMQIKHHQIGENTGSVSFITVRSERSCSLDHTGAVPLRGVSSARDAVVLSNANALSCEQEMVSKGFRGFGSCAEKI